MELLLFLHFFLLVPLVQNVQHLSAFESGRFHEPVHRLARLRFVFFVFDID